MNAEYFDKSIKGKRLEIAKLKKQKALWLYLTNDLDLFDNAAKHILTSGNAPQGLESGECDRVAASLAEIREMELNIYKFNFS